MNDYEKQLKRLENEAVELHQGPRMTSAPLGGMLDVFLTVISTGSMILCIATLYGQCMNRNRKDGTDCSMNSRLL